MFQLKFQHIKSVIESLFNENMDSDGLKNLNPVVKTVVVEEPVKVYYSKEECRLMSDEEFLRIAFKLTGNKNFKCKHCSSKVLSIKDNGLKSYRRKCEKYGLDKSSVVKTCDKQQERNDKSNPTNNSFYTKKMKDIDTKLNYQIKELLFFYKFKMYYHDEFNNTFEQVKNLTDEWNNLVDQRVKGLKNIEIQANPIKYQKISARIETEDGVIEW